MYHFTKRCSSALKMENTSFNSCDNVHHINERMLQSGRNATTIGRACLAQLFKIKLD